MPPKKNTKMGVAPTPTQEENIGDMDEHFQRLLEQGMSIEEIAALAADAPFAPAGQSQPEPSQLQPNQQNNTTAPGTQEPLLPPTGSVAPAFQGNNVFQQVCLQNTCH